AARPLFRDTAMAAVTGGLRSAPLSVCQAAPTPNQLILNAVSSVKALALNAANKTLQESMGQLMRTAAIAGRAVSVEEAANLQKLRNSAPAPSSETSATKKLWLAKQVGFKEPFRVVGKEILKSFGKAFGVDMLLQGITLSAGFVVASVSCESEKDS